MATTIEITNQLDVQGDPSIHVGDKNTPVEVLVTNGEVLHIDKVVVEDDYGRVTLWATGNGGVSDFTWGLIVSDSDLLIEVKNNFGTPQYSLRNIVANIPYYFGYYASGGTTERLSGTAVVVSGTGFGPVTQIKVCNNVAESVGDATLSFFLFR